MSSMNEKIGNKMLGQLLGQIDEWEADEPGNGRRASVERSAPPSPPGPVVKAVGGHRVLSEREAGRLVDMALREAGIVLDRAGVVLTVGGWREVKDALRVALEEGRAFSGRELVEIRVVGNRGEDEE